MNDIVERVNNQISRRPDYMRGVDDELLDLCVAEITRLRAENERLCRDNDRLLVLFKDAQICRDMK